MFFIRVLYTRSRVRSLLRIKKNERQRGRGRRKQRKLFALNRRGNKRWREGRIKNDILTLELIALNSGRGANLWGKIEKGVKKAVKKKIRKRRVKAERERDQKGQLGWLMLALLCSWRFFDALSLSRRNTSDFQSAACCGAASTLWAETNRVLGFFSPSGQGEREGGRKKRIMF